MVVKMEGEVEEEAASYILFILNIYFMIQNEFNLLYIYSINKSMI
jgi:hypothetical protein